MTSNIPECPPSLKSIQHYLKTAAEHDARDPVVAYWCRVHALQVGLKLTNKKTPEETKLLMSIMDWLEASKTANKDNEAVSNEVAAQAHLENYALKLFLYADKQDREQNYGKNIVKAFYTAGMIYDVLTTFGDLTDEAIQNRKYAKWKAAYIHNCLKTGETPVPGPMGSEGDEDESAAGVGVGGGGSSAADAQAGAGAESPPSVPDPGAVLRAASQLPPVPHTPDPHPGGFVPYDPAQQPRLIDIPTPSTSTLPTLSPEQLAKAQKYCKWAGSALNYDDVKTAINNLKNALELLQTGRDPA